MTKTTYTQSELEAGIKFLNNKNVHFELDGDEDKQVGIHINVNNNRIWTGGDSIWNNGVVKGVKVDYIDLRAHYDNWDEDAYWSGGLSGTIAYDGSGKDGTWYDGSDDANNVLINKIKDNRDSDGMIYTDTIFIENAIAYMEEHCDFDSKLLKDFLDFDYSEQGMQDDETVNLDVEMDGDFWLACYEQMQKQKKAA